MRKKTILLIIIFLVGFSIYRINKFLDRITTSDPEYNTIYTKNYQEKEFNGVRIKRVYSAEKWIGGAATSRTRD